MNREHRGQSWSLDACMLVLIVRGPKTHYPEAKGKAVRAAWPRGGLYAPQYSVHSSPAELDSIDRMLPV